MWPAFSVVLSEMLGVIIEPDNEAKVNRWTWAFVVVGAIAFVRSALSCSSACPLTCSLSLKFYCLGFAGEALTRRLRELSFRAITTQAGPVHQPNPLCACCFY